MTYNIHPIIVHFPIALLCIYSLLKIIPLYTWFPQTSWKQIERIFLVLGVLGACAALYTGEAAEHLLRPNHDLVEMHSMFAAISVWIYGALLLGEIIVWIGSKRALPKIVGGLGKVLTHRALSTVLALCALVAISVTGLLGGVMVYGATADPFAAGILKMLGL
ncbi:MAG: hypothetical protein RJB39_727 [Candidatus Parcubacteria bacterium]|jgi:uncharacterized membrane protein